MYFSPITIGSSGFGAGLGGGTGFATGASTRGVVASIFGVPASGFVSGLVAAAGASGGTFDVSAGFFGRTCVRSLLSGAAGTLAFDAVLPDPSPDPADGA